MTKRPSLRANVSLLGEAEAAAEHVFELQARQSASADGDRVLMTTSTIHLPSELLEALQQASLRRAARKRRADSKGRGGRPSVSEIVVELLGRHRDELEGMD
jgi:hypothetical protein